MLKEKEQRLNVNSGEQLQSENIMIENLKYLIIRAIRGMQYLLEWIPYKRSRICFISTTKACYGDNFKYLLEQLQQQKNELEIIWVNPDPTISKGKCNENIKVVKLKTFQHFLYQFTSRLIITDDSLYIGFIKRRKQIYLNTWHGAINYKRVGYEGIHFTDRLIEKIYQLKNQEPDYMISGSKLFSQNMKSAFRFQKTVFLEFGLPRNDILFTECKEQIQKVKREYGLIEERILLYAPTFRHDAMDQLFDIDIERLLRVLEKKYGGKWVFFYRAHYFVNSKLENLGEHFINVSEYQDMQELLCSCDFLISDYSSCMWDFIYTAKPCISYIPDYMRYKKFDRGFTTAGQAMPFPCAGNMDELETAIEKFNIEEYTKRIDDHLIQMGGNDNGSATVQIADFIQSKYFKGVYE